MAHQPPDQDSLHGENAARRQAITELLFFASVGDLYRCKKIIHAWGLNIKDASCCDYDRRTPLHLSAAEGAFSVVLWLLDHGAEVNPIDRFKRTPLEDAVRGDHGDLATLLIQRGGKVLDKEGNLVELADSPLAGNVRIFTDYDPEWEIDPATIKQTEKIGEGEFGVVYKANWNGTIVAVKVLKETGAVALGDFRTELNVLQKVHHPHTVQFLGAVTKQTPFMIVTEYMVGGSLADLFRGASSAARGQRFPSMWRSIQLALDMARGLAYLHNRSPQAVIHRDLSLRSVLLSTQTNPHPALPLSPLIPATTPGRCDPQKPANLMIGGPKVFTEAHKFICREETGVLKIADFGLSKSLKLTKPKRHNRDSATNTPDNSVMNGRANSTHTPKGGLGASVHSATEHDAKATQSYKLTGETGSYRYMAPEVFRHEPYNNKVDVYSFAMICFQLFEGLPPYWNMDPIEAARAAALKGLRPTWGATNKHDQVVPARLKRLVETCWSADYESRPEFVEVIEELEQVIKEVKMELPETGKRPTSPKLTPGVASAEDGPCCSVQ
ncbi:hypothetical protein CHLRE_12g507750v5 [Chlamydomonas reinhardtii]|uniref:Protein kinase domain-containing protein n=1 Tax=Chlamydomonas reinhardtii TaxID=3055 RepID=A0A2K3D2U6_CHLRE|nr:uncharacterized protein CHLRE_12g507750v5 [Chlamydomonas reinhardtii]PNW74839.1 hypothetical protein CHLRE_12g507750v5 [Chlamydomonas reinhardtii]